MNNNTQKAHAYTMALTMQALGDTTPDRLTEAYKLAFRATHALDRHRDETHPPREEWEQLDKATRALFDAMHTLYPLTREATR
jgi:hypothetical protein